MSDKKLYKVVSEELKSQDGGTFDYSPYLPKEDGSPGDWLPEVPVTICESGYHVTEYPNMWTKKGSRVFEVECKGDLQSHESVGVNDKYAVSSIRLLAEVKWFVDGDYNPGRCNTGHYNTGHRNTGDYNPGYNNTGDRNIGHRNTGHYNTGDYNTGGYNTGDYNTGGYNAGRCNTGYNNTGDYNTGDYNTGRCNTGHYNTGHRNTGGWNSCHEETGFLNTVQSDTIRVFNKPCKRSVWESADIPGWFRFYLDNEIGYKASWQKAYQAAADEEKAKVFKLPNFDAEVFYELSGIDLREVNDG